MQIHSFRLYKTHLLFKFPLFPLHSSQVNHIPQTPRVSFSPTYKPFPFRLIDQLMILTLVLFPRRQLTNPGTGIGRNNLSYLLVIRRRKKVQQIIPMKIGPGSKSSFHLRVVAFGLLTGLELALDGQRPGLRVALGLYLWFKKAKE